MRVDTVRLANGTKRAVVDLGEMGLTTTILTPPFRPQRDRYTMSRCSFCGRQPGLAEIWPGTAWVYRLCIDQPGCDGHKKTGELLRLHGVGVEKDTRNVEMPVLRREDGSLLWRPPANPSDFNRSWYAEPHMCHPVSAVIDQIFDASKYTGDPIRLPMEPWCAWCGWPIKGGNGPARDGLVYCEACVTDLMMHHDKRRLELRQIEKDIAEWEAPPTPMPVGGRSIRLLGDLHGPRL